MIPIDEHERDQLEIVESLLHDAEARVRGLLASSSVAPSGDPLTVRRLLSQALDRMREAFPLDGEDPGGSIATASAGSSDEKDGAR